MKIQCDVCNKKEASVYCTADEAALCDECDQRVHHANKLASKHERFSLLQPSSSDFPLCDICQEKRALIFCQQDRAILCRDCDIPLHTANEHTQKHNRFLLTGIKLSHIVSDNNNNNKSSKKDDIIISNNNNSNNSGCDLVPVFNPTNKPTSEISDEIPNLSATLSHHHVTNSKNSVGSTNNQLINNNGGSTTSNISEYLIDMLPGWRFEDVLVDSSSASLSPFGFHNKSGSNNNNEFGVNDDHQDVMSYSGNVENEELTSSNRSNNNQFENCWVPQAEGISSVVFGNHHHHHHHHQMNSYTATSGLFIHGTKQQQQQQQETSVNKFSNNNRNKYLNADDFFTVPEIITSSVVGSKRARSFW